MSSVSVRSYERRKSAGARLEPRSSLPPGEESKQAVKTRRVKSALETRREHESSTEVFPGIERRKADPSWGITQYSVDYSPKKPVVPVPVRPHSPTRKNNPHPSQVSSKQVRICISRSGVCMYGQFHQAASFPIISVGQCG